MIRFLANVIAAAALFSFAGLLWIAGTWMVISAIFILAN